MCFKKFREKRNQEYEKIATQIVSAIDLAYSLFSRIDYKCTFNGTNIHFDKTYVCDLNPNHPTLFVVSFLNQILGYLNLLNNQLTSFQEIKDQIDSPKIEFNYRVKDSSSIMQKLRTYIDKDGIGEFPLNKCLNDLFGMRVIVDCASFNELRNKLNDMLNNDKRFKIVDRFKESYRAIHIYFKKDNYSFRWEFQVWLKANEKEHKYSHKKHKQGYTKWESEYKNAKIEL